LPGDFGRLIQLLLVNHHLYDYAVEQTAKLGWVWCFSLPFRNPIYVVVHPDDVAHILHHNASNYIKGRETHDALADMLGEGIFTVDGDRWKRQRQAGAHLFKNRLLRSAVVVFYNKVKSNLFPFLGHGKIIDVQLLLHNFTMASFCEIAFGDDGILSSKDTYEFGRAFDACSRMIQLRQVISFWRLLPNAPVAHFVNTLDRVLYKIVDARLRAIRSDRSALDDNEDVISRFVSIPPENAGGLDFSDRKTLRDVAINFILAGRDTTAQLLTWSLYFITTTAGVEQKLLAEWEAAGLPISPLPPPPTMEMLKRLKYTKAVLDESLRLRPPVPLDFKEAVSADVLPKTKQVIPPNTLITWSGTGSSRNSNSSCQRN